MDSNKLKLKNKMWKSNMQPHTNIISHLWTSLADNVRINKYQFSEWAEIRWKYVADIAQKHLKIAK